MAILEITWMILWNQVQQFKEVWKIIPGYDGAYRVSTRGRVQTRKRQIQGYARWRLGDENDWRDMILSVLPNNRLRVGLCHKGISRTYYVHTLVLHAFVGPCPPDQECCHYPDRNPQNNHLCNLRWDTNEANHRDSVEHGTAAIGDRGPTSFIYQEVADLIRVEYAKGNGNQTDLAEKWGLNPCSISQIINNKIWHDPNYQPPNPGSNYVNGESHPSSKMNWTKVAEIREKRAAGRTFQSLGDEYGVTKQNIRSIVLNRTWKV